MEIKDCGITWIGKIPTHWSIERCKNLFRIKKKLVGDRAKEFTLLSLTKQGIIARDMDNPQGKFPAEFDTYQIVTPGDFVFCLFDVEETPRTVGLSSLHGMITGAYTVMKSMRSLTSRYLYYQFLSFDDDKRLRPLYTGMRNTIPKEVFMGIPLAYPPLQEQIAIATWLDIQIRRIDKRLDLLDKKRELLRELRKAVIAETISTGLRSDTILVDSGIPWADEVPAHWKVLRLKECFVDNSRHQSNKTVLSLSYGKIIEKDFTEKKGVTPESFDSYQGVHPGDVVLRLTDLQNDQKSLRVGYADMHGIITSAYLCVRGRGLHPKFSSYLLHDIGDIKKVFYGLGGGVRQSMKFADLASIPVPLPPKEEQEAIAVFLDRKLSQLDAQITLIDQLEALLKKQRKAIIYEAVTGKIDFSTHEPPQPQKAPAA